jgi:tRNA (cytidine/uridine-2'-O-)-methyltransferase
MGGGPLLHVVLHEPAIPNNTGNIGRTCVATGCRLHLIHPLGFSTDEKACRRAGLDYWPRLDVHEHADWGSYERSSRPERVWLFSTRGRRCYFDAEIRLGDHLVFGSEVGGLPGWLLSLHAERTVSMPMVPGERSLNVATAVCAAVYEGVRQMACRGEVCVDISGRLRESGVGEAI